MLIPLLLFAFAAFGLGFAVASLLSTGARAEELQEAYRAGRRDTAAETRGLAELVEHARRTPADIEDADRHRRSTA